MKYGSATISFHFISLIVSDRPTHTFINNNKKSLDKIQYNTVFLWCLHTILVVLMGSNKNRNSYSNCKSKRNSHRLLIEYKLLDTCLWLSTLLPTEIFFSGNWNFGCWTGWKCVFLLRCDNSMSIFRRWYTWRQFLFRTQR